MGAYTIKPFKKIKINDIALSVIYGTSNKAKIAGCIPVIRMGNLQKGEIDYTNLKYFDSIKGIEDCILEDEDLLFNRTNSAELVGKTSIFKGNSQFKHVVFASYIIRIRVNKDMILPAYLNYWLNSPEASIIKRKLISQQVGQANINGTKLKNIDFPFIDDLKEQEKIIDEVESRFSVVDKVETVIDASLAKAEKLRKSILKSAFEGKLVN